MQSSPEDFRFNTDNVTVAVAAAGAGKTSWLASRIAEMLETYRPEEIAFVTFTKKGVATGIERTLRENPGIERDSLLYFRTLHSLCFKALGLKAKSVVCRKYIKKFNEALGFCLTLKSGFEGTADDRLLARYDALRSGAALGEMVEGRFDPARYDRFVAAYEYFKQRHGLVDFYDCLERFADRGESVPVKVAFIDEAQDLTPLQWDVCRVAFADAERVFVAGDDYQTLFVHAGANPRYLIGLARRYGTVKLEKSYRISKEVYRFSRGIADLLQHKIEKDFAPVKSVEGSVKTIPDFKYIVRKIVLDIEANRTPSRWYMLFRVNHFIDSVAQVLEQECVPFHRNDEFCLDLRSLKRIKRYLAYRKAPTDATPAFMEKYGIADLNGNWMDSRLLDDRFADKTLERKKYVIWKYIQKYSIDDLIEMGEGEPVVQLSTIHRVKGGEADNVVVFLDATKKVMRNSVINLDEELRVLYVAATRARTNLYFTQQSAKKHSLKKLVETVEMWLGDLGEWKPKAA